MSQQAIFGPVLATMALTFVVWVYMYIPRISFITGSRLGPAELAIPGNLARLSPAWVFMVFRALHSAVHCSVNIVLLRFYLYLISTLALWFMVAPAALQFLSQ